MLRTILMLLPGVLLIGCSTTSQTAVNLNHPTTSATLWMQNAAEYDALATMVYRTASDNLQLANEDSYWTASLQQAAQEDSGYFNLPPAIVVDVDETVLDNSSFQARMIKQNSSYNIEAWNDWVREANADAIPGARAFTTYVSNLGITVFYLTNREHTVEDATRKNLIELDFPVNDSLDVLLTKNERDSWTSAKTERRQFVAERFRILMLVGDDLNDFISAKNISQEKREAIVEEHKTKWGEQWYILPNPVYGSWEQA
ncbi:MAG: HAD family acid phosphatase [Balneolaceae bacterium]|nr:HAD family acid phosphatase [Balneolaceae bacterium]